MTSPAIRFENPVQDQLGSFIQSSAARGLPLVERDCHADERGAVICGLGNSLQKPSTLREIRKLVKRGWYVFGLKEAITFLKSKKIPVHYSVNMDPTEGEVKRTPVYPDVIYCLASTCNPALYDYILDQGGEIRVYHSACGYRSVRFDPGFVLEMGDDDTAVILTESEYRTVHGFSFCPVAARHIDEVELYVEHFGIGDTVIGGFTCGNRAIGLARYMGFPNVTIAGLDFGWREDDDYYAPFCDAEPIRDIFMNDHGQVDGRPWKSRPDLLASAIDVARKIRDGKINCIGDSLAAALAKKDDEYLDRVCQIRK